MYKTEELLVKLVDDPIIRKLVSLPPDNIVNAKQHNNYEQYLERRRILQPVIAEAIYTLALKHNLRMPSTDIRHLLSNQNYLFLFPSVTYQFFSFPDLPVDTTDSKDKKTKSRFAKIFEHTLVADKRYVKPNMVKVDFEVRTHLRLKGPGFNVDYINYYESKTGARSLKSIKSKSGSKKKRSRNNQKDC